jgi:hypothetical protein
MGFLGRALAATALTAVGALGAGPLAHAGAAAPPVFRAGAAARSVDPPVPVFSGGFSLSPPITRTRDPLEVRAFYVSNGKRAVAFAVVDAQGHFAGYQEGAGFGTTAERADAAKAASADGRPAMTQADVIVQATHSHAGPTLEGIWGPVPLEYLQLVHDQVVGAIADAAARAQPAHLQFGTLDDHNIAAVNLNQDNYQGWVNDPQLSVLRAVSTRDGSTLGSYVSVPTHGAHIRGDKDAILSADYFGTVRHALDRRLGGTAVVGPASLGRLESPVETTGQTNMDWLAAVVENDVTQAMAHARWITDATIASADSLVQIPATNAALLALNDAWALSDDAKQQEAEQTGIYPIDRANTSPYRQGNVLGTYLTALRVGDVGFLSMPGEPFPEIRFTIARSVDAKNVVALSKGQDDFGYFYPSFVYPFPQVYNSDHAIFNVAPQAGDQIVQQQVANLGATGFTTSTAFSQPLPNDYAQKLRPGLQTLASPPTGDADASGKFTTTLQAIYMPASLVDAPLDGPVTWDFGDGTKATTGYLSVGQDLGQSGQGPHGEPILFTHAFAPGTYKVTASGRDTAGNAVAWTVDVTVYPRLVASARCRRTTFTGSADGGEGHVLSWQWRFSDGKRAEGRVVQHRARRAAVTVVDGAGGTATARAVCPVRHAARKHHRRRGGRGGARFTG